MIFFNILLGFQSDIDGFDGLSSLHFQVQSKPVDPRHTRTQIDPVKLRCFGTQQLAEQAAWQLGFGLAMQVSL